MATAQTKEQKSKLIAFRSKKYQRIKALAKAMDRNVTDILNEAVDGYLEVYEWQVEHINKAIKRADKGKHFISHEEIKKRVKNFKS
jgi:predicted transcriptional regulator